MKEQDVFVMSGVCNADMMEGGRRLFVILLPAGRSTASSATTIERGKGRGHNVKDIQNDIKK